MKRVFSIAILGYNRRQVEKYLSDMRKDYEEELSKKKERMLQLMEENNKIKSQLKELEKKLEEFSEREAYISKALVRAEQKAQAIIEEGRQKIAAEMYQLEMEKNKWKARCKEIRRQLLEFEYMVCTLMENFYSEINYLKSKDLTDSIFAEEEDMECDKNSEEENAGLLSVS
ncbi:cell division septum initiation protein DivIVA [Caldicoprobacter guelmensis]|uniref:DivIVA domain-containing protein n=1 Tax=Caldicoprobacter guelmensis TaxID=1170224 RepID=UPI001957F6D2|nr:DivIVA domain-containing protein [Caldicoprobacter guelmensis]MBM7581929.1 cell division septum initiation protein DivIVA [Caldicoprobacter guelmensis]